MDQRSLAKRLWYDFLHIVCRILGVVLFRIRCAGREHIPSAGGALILSNHQSNLDPILIGLACDRRINALARQTLFRFPPFRWLIQSLNAIPLDREGTGLGGLKETLRRLKQGGAVLIFPEGTRTRTGEIGPLRPGFCALAKRANVPLVPAAMDGAYQAWPRTRLFPSLCRIAVQFGPPIMPAEIAAMNDEQLLAEVARRLRACHAQARELRK